MSAPVDLGAGPDLDASRRVGHTSTLLADELGHPPVLVCSLVWLVERKLQEGKGHATITAEVEAFSEIADPKFVARCADLLLIL